ncbi:hypothetical protein [Mannheimia haemolytica]|uniref:hypothetical protein n=1 Tax=Mannheimia haemolytica TaxID=75985 RepID=UPI001CF46FF6|nr:hypothetical protein [Mannheimia haemolytica]MCB4227883.1 hypothetical protein [Mannheimia haemolytica]
MNNKRIKPEQVADFITQRTDAIILSLLANAVYGGHNNSQISYQETEEVNLDARLRQVEGDVREIKSNLTCKCSIRRA